MKAENKISFRNYKPEDFDEVMNLWKLTGMGGEERGDDNEVIMRTINAGGNLTLMIKENKIIGTFWLTHDNRRTFLHHFGIHPDFQGQGLATKLMGKCMQEIEKIGFQVKLEVHKENIPALKIYRKYGFVDFPEYELMMLRKLP
ncbi:MAG: GNAT family N-acetyltransferase [Chlorobi bacterium]|nr:GNAT family N-acetyltransferase [Chlorobiota bacterium]